MGLKIKSHLSKLPKLPKPKGVIQTKRIVVRATRVEYNWIPPHVSTSHSQRDSQTHTKRKHKRERRQRLANSTRTHGSMTCQNISFPRKTGLQFSFFFWLPLLIHRLRSHSHNIKAHPRSFIRFYSAQLYPSQ